MNERALLKLLFAGGLLVAGAAATALRWNGPLALGIAAGGAWNLLNLWCLATALTVWLDQSPSRRRAIGWFVIKFPLLYLAVFCLLSRPSVSPIGFGIGFTIVLALAAALLIVRSRSTAASASSTASAHGR